MVLQKTENAEETVTFSGLSDEKKISRMDEMGKNLWTEAFVRDPQFGNFTVALLGKMGSGKSSLMLWATKRILETYPNELCLWREPYNCILQTANLIPYGVPLNLCAEKKLNMKVFESIEDETMEQTLIPQHDIIVHEFESQDDLLSLLKKKHINLVYYSKRSLWFELLSKMKENRAWQTFFWDEISRMVPDPNVLSSKDAWHNSASFCTSVEQLRKNRIGLWLSTHSLKEIDYRLKQKIMISIHLRGSSKPQDSPIYQEVFHTIQKGQALIEYCSEFGKLRFQPLFPAKKQYFPHTEQEEIEVD